MKLTRLFPLAALGAAVVLALFAKNLLDERKALKLIIERLSADSRIAQVLVTDVRPDPAGGTARTTIKFVEFDAASKPLPPKYFTFKGNMIQFQSLVIRFDDLLVGRGDRFRGKSAYVFLKAFSLVPEPQVYEINAVGAVPGGYEVPQAPWFQKRLWKRFWRYALGPDRARRGGVKNAQLEAPGTMFVPGMLYTVKIEHDGGMRIDAQELPGVLKERTAL